MTDAELFDAFGRAAVPRPQWTHRAHLRVAWMFLERFPPGAAFEALRDGIKALNMANGVADTPDEGYHETVTGVFIAMVQDARRRSTPAVGSGAFCDAHPELFDKATLLRHYSRERINSREARAAFVEPDLLPLPGD